MSYSKRSSPFLPFSLSSNSDASDASAVLYCASQPATRLVVCRPLGPLGPLEPPATKLPTHRHTTYPAIQLSSLSTHPSDPPTQLPSYPATRLCRVHADIRAPIRIKRQRPRAACRCCIPIRVPWTPGVPSSACQHPAPVWNGVRVLASHPSGCHRRIHPRKPSSSSCCFEPLYHPVDLLCILRIQVPSNRHHLHRLCNLSHRFVHLPQKQYRIRFVGFNLHRPLQVLRCCLFRLYSSVPATPQPGRSSFIPFQFSCRVLVFVRRVTVTVPIT